jgi:hypothetical protein
LGGERWVDSPHQEIVFASLWGLVFCLHQLEEAKGKTFKTVSDPQAPRRMHKLLRQIYGVLRSRNAFDAQFLGNRLDFQDGI